MQSGRALRSRRGAGLFRLSGRRSLGLAGVPGRVPSRPCRPVGRLRRVLPRARCTRPAGRSERPVVHPRVPGPQPLPLPGRGGLCPGGPARPDLASPRVERPSSRDRLGGPARARRPTGRLDLPEPRQSGLGRRRPHAPVGGRPRRDATSVRRLEGSAGRPLRARRQHGRRRVRAAAGAPAQGRPRDHPRRQQHGHRVLPRWPPDDPAAALLGPVRQRPAGGTRRGSACASRRTPSNPRR